MNRKGLTSGLGLVYRLKGNYSEKGKKPLLILLKGSRKNPWKAHWPWEGACRKRPTETRMLTKEVGKDTSAKRGFPSRTGEGEISDV